MPGALPCTGYDHHLARGIPAPGGWRQDVDEDLYNGFVGNNDRRVLNRLRGLPPGALATARPSFDDSRLDELLFRYRARNFPAALLESDTQRWHEHRAARLFNGTGGARTLEKLFNDIDALAETADERGEAILSAQYDYAEAIVKPPDSAV